MKKNLEVQEKVKRQEKEEQEQQNIANEGRIVINQIWKKSTSTRKRRSKANSKWLGIK